MVGKTPNLTSSGQTFAFIVTYQQINPCVSITLYVAIIISGGQDFYCRCCYGCCTLKTYSQRKLCMIAEPAKNNRLNVMIKLGETHGCTESMYCLVDAACEWLTATIYSAGPPVRRAEFIIMAWYTSLTKETTLIAVKKLWQMGFIFPSLMSGVPAV